MSTTRKITTRKYIEERLHVDQVTLSKGVFTVRQGFYYRLGGSEDQLVEKVLAAFPDAKIIDKGEVWRPFRGGASVASQSHWFVKFTFDAEPSQSSSVQGEGT